MNVAYSEICFVTFSLSTALKFYRFRTLQLFDLPLKIKIKLKISLNDNVLNRLIKNLLLLKNEI